MGNWSWAVGSVRGSAHLRDETRKQDAYRVSAVKLRPEILVSIVSDGAGSANFGGEGASIVCRAFSLGIRRHFLDFSTLPDDRVILSCFDEARDAIARAATKRLVSQREFAATLVMTIASPNGVICAHIGDGAVVARRSSDHSWTPVSWPECGPYASTTYFVTDDGEPRLRISSMKGPFDTIVSFTDGIESLALNLQDRLPHIPFFETMSKPVRSSKDIGYNRRLSGLLNSFLCSKRVSDKTDDDITLVIATR